MARQPTELSHLRLIESHWRLLVADWAQQHGYRADLTGSGVSLKFPDRPGGLSSAHFGTSKRCLVAYLMHSKVLSHHNLAQAAAVANAWNTMELVPMLSVRNLHSDQPRLVGVCTLPLTWQALQQDFNQTVSSWIHEAQRMFVWCDEKFGL